GRGGGGVAQGDLHLEIVGALVILLVFVEIERADKLLADEDVGGIAFLRHHADAGVAEQTLEVSVELAHFENVHGSPSRLVLRDRRRGTDDPSRATARGSRRCRSPWPERRRPWCCAAPA